MDNPAIFYREESAPQRVVHARRCEWTRDGFEVSLAVGRPMSPPETLRLAWVACAASLAYILVLIGIALLLPETVATIWCASAFTAGVGIGIAWLRRVWRCEIRITAQGNLITIDDAEFACEDFEAFAVLERDVLDSGSHDETMTVEIGHIGYTVRGHAHELGTLRADVAERVVAGLNQWLLALARSRAVDDHAPAHPRIGIDPATV